MSDGLEGYNPRRAWLVTITAALFAVTGYASLNLLTPVLSMILEDFGMDANYGASLNFFDTATSAIVAIPIGLMVNKWGARKVGFAGFAILLITYLWGAMPFVDATQLLVIRCLEGFGYAVPAIMALTIVTQWFPDDKQAFPIVVVTMMVDVSRVMVLQVSKFTIPLGGWHAQYMGQFAFCCIAFVFFIFFFHENHTLNRHREAADAKSEKAPLREVLSDRNVWLIIIVTCCFTLVRRGFDPFANMIWVEICGVENNVASDINSLLSALNIPSGLMYGFIISRCRSTRGRIAAGLITVYFVGMTSAFFMNQWWMPWVFAVVIGLVGCVLTYNQAALTMLIKRPAVLTMAVSLFDVVGKYICGSIAPYVGSVIRTSMGSWIYCSIPYAILGAIGIVCIWKLGFNIDRHTKQFDEKHDRDLLIEGSTRKPKIGRGRFS